MTTKEFSDAFDTLLSSYNHKADFGDLSSYADVVLDEYEKSVFLTQAQDNIVKSYFDRLTNSTGLGFDDSIRRLVDFSSLISTATPREVPSDSWRKNSILFKGTTNTLKGNGTSYLFFKLEVKFGENVSGLNYGNVSTQILDGGFIITLRIKSNVSPKDFYTNVLLSYNSGILGNINFDITDSNSDNYLGIFNNTTPINELVDFSITSDRSGSSEAYDERGSIYQLPPNILLMLNERIKNTDGKYCVVIPISYKEYDRQMSRAYAQPLKKQCWRLYEGESSTNTLSEIIPKEGDNILYYKIRYIRRPNPIILTNLNLVNSQEPLKIDGYSDVSECELHPILHMDILEEAVRLALNSKGIETREQRAAREAASKSRS